MGKLGSAREMRYLRAIRSSDRGWRPAVRFSGAALLNQRWHRASDRCPACEGEFTAADHAVHCGGEIFHPGCLLYRGTRE